MMVQSVHPRLLVDNYQTSFLFYRDVLGIEVTFGDETSDYADFSTGTSDFSLFSRTEMAAIPGPSIQTDGDSDRFVLVLAVHDVDRFTAELAAKGVTLLTPPEDRPDWGIRTAHFRDPEGNLIEMYASLRSNPWARSQMALNDPQ